VALWSLYEECLVFEGQNGPFDLNTEHDAQQTEHQGITLIPFFKLRHTRNSIERITRMFDGRLF
jgi:hypothetical protein